MTKLFHAILLISEFSKSVADNEITEDEAKRLAVALSKLLLDF